jgi:uncharacterized membrane protein YhaH (DUF805 family)
MSVGHYLFSFSGRINRAKQWLLVLIGLVFGIGMWTALISVLGLQNILDVAMEKLPVSVLTGNPGLPIAGAVIGLIYLVLVYVHFAVTAKRLHDRNKSAWWLLVFLVLPMILGFYRLHVMMPAFAQLGTIWSNALHGIKPPRSNPFSNQPPLATILGGVSSLISLWAFVELYCLPGTAGDNPYGPDPLARRIT